MPTEQTPEVQDDAPDTAEELGKQMVAAGEPAETTPAETAEPETQETEEEPSDLFSRLEKHGVQVRDKYRDEEALLEGMANLNRRLGQRDDEARSWQWLQQNPHEALKWLQSQVGQQEPPKEPEKKETPTWDAPEWDDSWESQVELEGGIAVPKPGHDPSIAAKYNKAMRWAAGKQRQILLNPEDALGPVIEKKLKPAIDRAEKAEQEVARLRQQLSNDRDTEVIREVCEANASWMFQGGKFNPVNLQANTMTEPGLVWRDHALRLLKVAAMSGQPYNAQEIVEDSLARTRWDLERRMAQQQQPSKQPIKNGKAAVKRTQVAASSIDDDEFPDGMTLAQALLESRKLHPE